MSPPIVAPPPASAGDPIEGQDVRRLLQVIDDLVAVRPVNWEDSRDHQQRRAWAAADAALVRFRQRRRGA